MVIYRPLAILFTQQILFIICEDAYSHNSYEFSFLSTSSSSENVQLQQQSKNHFVTNANSFLIRGSANEKATHSSSFNNEVIAVAQADSSDAGKPTSRRAQKADVVEKTALRYFDLYKTEYSQPLVIAMNVIVCAFAIAIVMTLWEYRSCFPINVVPFWLQMLSHFGTFFALIATTHAEAFEAATCVMWWFAYPIFLWFPFGSSVLMIMWRVQVTYGMQQIRMGQTINPLMENIYKKSYPRRALLAQYAGLSILVTLPQCLLLYLDSTMDTADSVLCTPQWTPAKLFFVGQPFAGGMLVMFLGFKLRHVQDEFQLTKNFAKMASVFCSTALPLRMMHTLFGDHLPLSIQKHTRFAEAAGWFVSFAGYLFFVGYTPWRLAMHYQRDSQKQTHQRGERSKETGSNAAWAPSISTRIVPTVAVNGSVVRPYCEKPERVTFGSIMSSSSALPMDQLLKHPAIVKMFGKYCMGEFCAENVLFLEHLEITKASFIALRKDDIKFAALCVPTNRNTDNKGQKLEDVIVRSQTDRASGDQAQKDDALQTEGTGREEIRAYLDRTQTALDNVSILISDFLKSGSVNEINISSKLRKTTVSTLERFRNDLATIICQIQLLDQVQGDDRDGKIWANIEQLRSVSKNAAQNSLNECEKEVYAMLSDPFRRFLRKNENVLILQ